MKKITILLILTSVLGCANKARPNGYILSLTEDAVRMMALEKPGDFTFYSDAIAREAKKYSPITTDYGEGKPS
jgi:hypothetical protein